MRILIQTLLFVVLAVQATLVSANRPGSFFITSINGTVLTINTKTPNWFYQFAGIKVLTPGVKITGPLTPSDNGFRLFAVSDTQKATFTVIGSTGVLQLKLCLNGVGSTYGCETVSVGGASPSNSPTLNTFISTEGGATGVGLGNNFVPGLGSIGSNTVKIYSFATTDDADCKLNAQLGTAMGTANIISNTKFKLSQSFHAYLAPTTFCIAVCNASVTANIYPGQSSSCTNPVPFVPAN